MTLWKILKIYQIIFIRCVVAVFRLNAWFFFGSLFSAILSIFFNGNKSISSVLVPSGFFCFIPFDWPISKPAICFYIHLNKNTIFRCRSSMENMLKVFISTQDNWILTMIRTKCWRCLMAAVRPLALLLDSWNTNRMNFSLCHFTKASRESHRIRVLPERLRMVSSFVWYLYVFSMGKKSSLFRLKSYQFYGLYTMCITHSNFIRNQQEFACVLLDQRIDIREFCNINWYPVSIGMRKMLEKIAHANLVLWF